MTTTDIKAPVLEHLDPNSLILMANIRELPVVGPEFVANIAELGVLEPIVGYRTPDGVAVKYGQRRTLAARGAHLELVPVYVHDTEPDTAERIVTQWAENEQREGLSMKDKVGAVHQLALIGWTPDQIATRLDVEPEDVGTALKVAKSPTALEYTAAVTLEYAALVAELEDGDLPEGMPTDYAEATIARIMEAAATGQPVEHLAATIRSEREEAEVRAKIVAKLAEKGYAVYEPEYPTPHGITRVGNVKPDADGEPFTDDSHKDCPHRAVSVSIRKSWKHQQDPEAHPEKWEVTLTHYCLDWPKAGHVEARPQGLMSEDSGKKKAADMTDDEREKAKAERDHVKASNKAWREATPVRQDWLLKLGQIKKPLPGGEAFLARAFFTYVTLSPANLGLVGLETTTTGHGVSTKELDRVNIAPARALHIAVCVAVASVEKTLTDDAWRSQVRLAGPYLEVLGKWGYPLADIEKRIIADAKAQAKGNK